MTYEADYLFIYLLAFCISSLVKLLLRYFPISFMGTPHTFTKLCYKAKTVIFKKPIKHLNNSKKDKKYII